MELNTRQVNVIERADQGLRAFFGKIYNFMAGGLVLSAVMAYLASQQPIVGWMYSISAKGISLSLIGWIVTLAPFALIFMMNSAVQKANPQKAGMLFWVFSALMGLSLGNIFLLYSGASIAQTFLVTAGSFLALSIYGSSTKRDLSGLGSFLFMGLIGLILASLANIFFKSSSASFVISVIGVIIFAGFTVYAQLAVDSEFNFVYNNTQYATNGPVYVNISEDGTREIGWTSTTGGTIDIVDIAQGLTALEQISELLSVVIFDQYGKVIYTDAASYTLREGLEGTNRYINIVNNEITGFNSTGGETINTHITANISSIYSTDLGEEIAPENVNFEIYGAGVSRVDYDNSTDSQEHNYVSGSLAQGTVSKYLVLNDEIVLNDLIRVWVGDEENYINDDETYLSFRLNSDYLHSVNVIYNG